MRHLLAAFFAASLIISASLCIASDREPIAHVVEISLAGDDLTKGTVIVREGAELKPTIWMPLYDGDIVFVRDPKSRVFVDYGAGGRVQIGDGAMRVEITDEMAHGGETWGLITALGKLFAGDEGEEVPANLISKGDEGTLFVPAANRTPNNILRDDSPVWIVWSGGAGPFKIVLDNNGKTHELATSEVRDIRFDIPKDASQRLIVTVTDAKQRSVRVPLRLRDAQPTPPSDLSSGGQVPHDLVPALAAAWLANQDDGAWRLEAARALRNSANGNLELKRMSDALFAGWRP